MFRCSVDAFYSEFRASFNAPNNDTTKVNQLSGNANRGPLAHSDSSLAWEKPPKHHGQVSIHANSTANYAKKRCHDFSSVQTKHWCKYSFVKQRHRFKEFMFEWYAESETPRRLVSIHEAVSLVWVRSDAVRKQEPWAN